MAMRPPRPATSTKATEASPGPEPEQQPASVPACEPAGMAPAPGMTELAAGAMHDIVQPIMAIMARGNATLRSLRRDDPDVQGAITAIGRMIADCERAAGIVECFRATVAGIRLPREPVCLDGLVRDTLVDLDEDLRLHAVQTELRLAHGGAQVMGCRLPLRQVMVNLLTNAIHAMKRTTGARILSIEVAIDGDDAILVVEDTGCGFAHTDFAHIFDEFYTTRENGMGMGLAICRSIVMAHEGSIAAAQREKGPVRASWSGCRCTALCRRRPEPNRCGRPASGSGSHRNFGLPRP